jgi:GNAT superfamily N-acetyltransferase
VGKPVRPAYRGALMKKPRQQWGIVIRELARGEEAAVAELVMRMFHAYVGHEYGDRGVEEFAGYADSSALRDRFDSGECLILVALCNDELVGMIELRGTDHLSMLFVDDRFHRRGIARALLEGAIQRLAGPGAELSNIEVNSSRYAIPIYRRLGFEISGPEQTVNGITFTPMRRGNPPG